ncbi:CsbD family protein [Frigoribacterium salinisoli]
MSIGDKAKDAVQQAAGKAEEFVGKKTDDAELTAQGRKDQSMGEDRMETEKAKDETQH